MTAKTFPIIATKLYPSLALDWNGNQAEVVAFQIKGSKIEMTVEMGGRKYFLTPGVKAVFKALNCTTCGATDDDNHAEAHLAYEESLMDEIQLEAIYG